MSLADRQLSLNCWVFGDEVPVNRIFPVEIADTENVSILKDAIKAQKPVAFQHVPADALDLWQVRVHCVDAPRSTPELWQVDVPADDDAIRNINLDGVRPLLPLKLLSGLFEQAPADEHLHIVIGRPPNISGVCRHLPYRVLVYSELSITAQGYQPQSAVRQLSLNCLVFGEKASRVFTVKIADTKNVAMLRDAIKAKRPVAFQHVPARYLDLWHVSVSIAVDDELEEHVLEFGIEDRKPLFPLAKLSKVFPSSLVDENLHVIIRAASGNHGRNLVLPD